MPDKCAGKENNYRSKANGSARFKTPQERKRKAANR